MKKILVLILIMLLPLSVCAETLADYAKEYKLEELIDYDLEIFKDFSLDEIQQSLLKGEGFDSMNIIRKFIALIISEFKAYIKMFIMLIICGFIVGAGTGTELIGKGNKDVAVCAGYCIFAGMLCRLYMEITGPVVEYIEYISVAGKSLVAILIGIVYAKGGAVTGLLMNSGVIVMLNGFLEVFGKILIPLITSSALVSVADNFSDKIKITALKTNLRSVAKWILSFILALFTGVLGIYSVAGGNIDITIRKATKLAVGTALPVVGGVMAESMETIGAVLSGVSSIVGISGLIVLVMYGVVPVVKLLVLRWGLKMCIVIMEPFSSGNIIKVSEDICECITYMFAIFTAGLLLMCGSVGVIMLTGNYL